MRYLQAQELPGAAQALAAECRAVRVDDLGTGRLTGRMPLLRVGDGPIQIALKGNAHADEPAGTVTCFELARWLATAPDGQRLAGQATFHLLPSANPDGLARNAEWMVGETPDPVTWMQTVHRDPPAEDREFGYGDTPEQATHPECAAWHGYLASLPALHGYVSLHSMAFAGGAWFLAMLDDLDRRQPLLAALAQAAADAGLPLHDEDRGGRKGFSRIQPGFCSAPTRDGMAAFFRAAGTPAAADWLKLNSMQVVQRLHGTPVALVSELPQWYHPRLADLRPVERPRAELDLAVGACLLRSLDELDSLLDEARDGAAWAEAIERREHRAAVAQSLINLAGDWGDRRSTARDEMAADLQALRVTAENAALGLRLASSPAERRRWQARLECRVAALWALGRFQPLRLSAQVALQQTMVLKLVEHLTGDGA